MKSLSFSSVLSVVLASSLVVSPLWGQTPAAETRSNDGTVLQLRVVDRDGSQAQVSSTSARGFTVEVTDASGTPVEGVAVAMRLPDDGATGMFAGSSHSAVIYTNTAGLAHFSGIHWSATPGAVPVRIVAAKGSGHAGLLLEESLVEGDSASQSLHTPPAPGQLAQSSASQPAAVPAQPAQPTPNPEPSVTVSNTGSSSVSHGGSKKWIILAVIAAAAGGGLAMASKGKSSTAASSTTSALSIGTPSVSIGHP